MKLLCLCLSKTHRVAHKNVEKQSLSIFRSYIFLIIIIFFIVYETFSYLSLTFLNFLDFLLAWLTNNYSSKMKKHFFLSLGLNL